ncbi:MAG: hypothetical protein HY860_06150 [Chlamydiales bacterium]|nr:hypothetical protein [Chlamydiales bacterium]
MLYQVEKYAKYLLMMFSLITMTLIFCIKPDDILSAHPTVEAQVCHQKRSMGTKDLWTVEDGSRLHHHLENLSSTLTIIPGKHGLEVIENMDHIRCWMQDKVFLSPPHQKIRYFKSTHGMYFYKQHELHIQDVLLAMYEQNGIELVKEIQPSLLLFKGKAKEASFNITENKVDFFASHFEAVFEEDIQ